jgi:hypothetical protein
MTVSIALTIDDGGLAPALGRLVALGEDLTPVYEALGLRFVENVKRRFALEVEPDLTPWMTTHPRASKKNPKTLQDSGPAPGSLIDRQFSQAARDGVEWGTDWPFARTHQFGATIRPKNAKVRMASSSSPRRFTFRPGRWSAGGRWSARPPRRSSWARLMQPPAGAPRHDRHRAARYRPADLRCWPCAARARLGRGGRGARCGPRAHRRLKAGLRPVDG